MGKSSGLSGIRSSMELMLEALLRKDDQSIDSPPALPTRPASMARFPPARRRLLPISTDFELGIIKNEALHGESDDDVGFDLIKNGISKNMIISQRLLTAVLVIQRYIKGWILLQRRKKAALCLQHGIRDWLSRKHLDHHQSSIKLTCLDEYKVNNINHLVVVNDLQRKLLEAEHEIARKEAEKADLVQKLDRFDKKWLEYIERMKSLEKFWDDKLSSLKISQDAAAIKKRLTSMSENNKGVQFDDEEEEWNEEYKLEVKKSNSIDELKLVRRRSTARRQKKWWGSRLLHWCLCLNSSFEDEDEPKNEVVS